MRKKLAQFARAGPHVQRPSLRDSPPHAGLFNRRISILFIVVSVFLVLVAASVSAQPDIASGQVKQFFALEDNEAQRSFAQISSDKFEQDFFRVTIGRTSATQPDSALWLRFSLPAADNIQSTRVLVVGPAYLDEAWLYRVDGTDSNAHFTQRSGDSIPFHQKPYPNRLQVFELSDDGGEYYLRATSEGILSIDWEILDEEAFLGWDREQNTGYAVLLGILTTMILFNMGIFIGIRDTTYVYYVVYHICAALLIFSLSGYSSQFLWPTVSNSTNTSIPIALTGMSLCGLVFIYSFLELRSRLPRYAKLAWYALTLVFLLALPGLLLPYSQGVKFTYAGCFIVLVVMGYIVVMARRNKIVAARYFGITFGFAVLPGSLGAFSYELGLLPDNLFFSHMLEITTVAETLLISLFLAYRIKLSETEKLRAQQKSIDLQASFNERMLAKQEEERSRIARELHDSVGPNLSALQIHLSSQEAAAASGTSPMMSDEQTRGLLKKTITEVRQLSHNLHPSHLDHLSLTSAIEMFTQQFHGEGMPAFKLALNIEEKLIPEARKIHLYRIVQEAVQNVINHADASHCYLSLTRVADNLQLSIRDNGRGFNSQGSQNGGLGMTSMADRANIINAQLDIDAQAGEGTRITVQFTLLNSDD